VAVNGPTHEVSATESFSLNPVLRASSACFFPLCAKGGPEKWYEKARGSFIKAVPSLLSLANRD